MRAGMIAGLALIGILLGRPRSTGSTSRAFPLVKHGVQRRIATDQKVGGSTPSRRATRGNVGAPPKKWTDRDCSQAGGRRCRCMVCVPGSRSRPGATALPLPHTWTPRDRAVPNVTTAWVDLGVEGRSADKSERPGCATLSSRACPSSRACLHPSPPVWRHAPQGSPAGGRVSC
jgi:hypothetical protein